MISLIDGTAEIWFRYMASATIQATLLALFILSVLRLGRRWSPALRYALLLLALCKFAIPPTVSIPTGLFGYIHQPQWSALASPSSDASPAPQRMLRAIAIHSDISQAIPGSSIPNPELSQKGKLLLLHLLGAILLISMTVFQRRRLSRLASRATEVQDPVLAEAYDALCRSMRLLRKPRLLISSDHHAPIAFGTYRPIVIMPQALVAALPLSEIRVILGHELAHHLRRDPWIAWPQVIISAVWWFNPVYWLLSRSIRGVREDYCDDVVLASGLASREAYCQTLLNAARTVLKNKAVTLAAFAYFGKWQPLQRRFRRIMSTQYIRAPKLAGTGILITFALGLVLLPGMEPRILAQNEASPVTPVGSMNSAAQPAIAVAQKADTPLRVQSRSAKESREENQDRGPSPQENAMYGYLKWLNEDVAYIITAGERATFLALGTNEERDFFIEQFWASRNPDPVASTHAFKEEHYRRIAYANEHFTSGIPGWKTDRGRIYILYGKPDAVESIPAGHVYREPSSQYGGTVTAYPVERWRYRYINGVGDDIEIEFVDKAMPPAKSVTGESMTGEFRMVVSPEDIEKTN